MTIAQFLCGLFKHKPVFTHFHPNGAWMYKCTRCNLAKTGFMFKEMGCEPPLPICKSRGEK